MESVPVTAPFDEIPAKFAHYLTSVDTQRLDHWLMALNRLKKHYRMKRNA